MKKFKFKLDGLLKVREFKEKRIKMELGEILREIQSVEDNLKKLSDDISVGYDSHEKVLQSNTNGKMLQFYPMFLRGKREDISNKETLLYSLRRKYDVKLKEMATARGEVKVIENLKEKEKTEFRKERNKKIQEDLEEILVMKRNGKSEISL